MKCPNCKKADGSRSFGGYCPACGAWSTVSIRLRTRALLSTLHRNGGTADEVIYAALAVFAQGLTKRKGVR